MAQRLNIAVDVDGTIVENGFPDLRRGLAVAGALEWLDRFRRHGAYLMIFTVRRDTRALPAFSDALRWCAERGLVLGLPGPGKPAADLFIDDRAFGCPLRESERGRMVVDWAVVGPAVMDRICCREDWAWEREDLK